MTLSCAACGAKADAVIGDQAATRGADEGAGEIYIDDEAIALAGSAASSAAASSAARAAFDLVNQQRASAGLGTLTWSDGLASAALVRAQEIVGTFSHTRPDGSAWYTVNSSIMYGENLAKLYNSADGVVAAWMASPTHAANIMDGGFKTMGISVYQTEDGSWYWAQEFGY
ncbi:MAG: CAP domain-containing protein [Butyrivibrio sp.]|nr:CAP domain-containing protein [Butyrivibrio sp.]